MNAESIPDRSDEGPVSPWQFEPAPTGEEGRPFAELIAQLRRVQTLANSIRPPREEAEAVTERLREVAGLLEPWVVPEQRALAGKRRDLPGRGHSLLVPFVADEQDDSSIAGRLVFDRFYLGGNGAAHGGALPLLFDEVLGMLGNSGGRTRARTAYLHVNYRAITPVDRELVLRAAIEREDGRKRFVTATLHDGEHLVADAEGLFVELRPGQP
jgi:acyl-coenzyme A thioesterase PaaI-like protein